MGWHAKLLGCALLACGISYELAVLNIDSRFGEVAGVVFVATTLYIAVHGYVALYVWYWK